VAKIKMEFEFDKEMDALLRQTAQGETASENPKTKIQNPKPLHLDADEISLFAENALPKKLRENAVIHFADCDRCRRILSDLIEQNSENEIVSAKQAEVFAPTIPWYRKFFAFPNLAYTLGAFVLVFSGLIAFTVLQSADKYQTADVSQVSERQTGGGKGMSSDGEAVIVENESSQTGAPDSMPNTAMSNSMSNAAMSNSASSSNSMKSNAQTNSIARSSNANMASNSSAISNKSSVSANTSPKEEARAEVTSKSVSELPLQSRTINNLNAEKRDKVENKAAETSDMTKSAPASTTKPTGRSVSADGMDTSDAESAKAKKMARAQSVETTSAGGKTFNRANNVWVDSAYKNQPAAVITRGTKEYKKLDSGLRSIVENLGGTIIIVWKEKAYRIQ
jgi:hypothetical protein